MYIKITMQIDKIEQKRENNRHKCDLPVPV